MFCIVFYTLMTMWRLFLRRIPIEDVPCGSDEEVSQWCRQLFVEKVSKSEKVGMFYFKK